MTLPPPRALLFDMDGTLTRPMLDFDAIRAEIGIEGPILESMNRMNPADRRRADEILDCHERHAAEQSELNEGCRDLLSLTATLRLPTALITRNSRSSVDIVLAKHGLRFDLLVSREIEPPKPHPAPLLFACATLGVEPAEAWMIGDGSHDIEAAVAAGVPSVWIDHGTRPTFTALPTRTVSTLSDLHQLLQQATG